MKFIYGFLDIIKYVFIGAFIGDGIVTVFNFITKPEIFEAQSSPWYMQLLISLACCIIVYGAIEIVKWILKLIFRR